MKAKHILVIISLLAFGFGAGYVFDMETGKTVREVLPWANMLIGATGMAFSVKFWRKTGN